MMMDRHYIASYICANDNVGMAATSIHSAWRMSRNCTDPATCWLSTLPSRRASGHAYRAVWIARPDEVVEHVPVYLVPVPSVRPEGRVTKTFSASKLGPTWVLFHQTLKHFIGRAHNHLKYQSNTLL
jgi:hypothetical protein